MRSGIKQEKSKKQIIKKYAKNGAIVGGTIGGGVGFVAGIGCVVISPSPGEVIAGATLLGGGVGASVGAVKVVIDEIKQKAVRQQREPFNSFQVNAMDLQNPNSTSRNQPPTL
ncbi:hypothetical protein [Spiroplasma endosymbiont of Lariophagus distinguendus]|uniref:hypothetical protein n=1 Tax=Spiroplasma endosymbiont of Lariophagus distinguendus TaxID=2935082 RepID=UPI00207A8F89|nr:hypothetical protein [Spiroplasma endosymbiont of Lariophagus distinguendus]